LVTGRRTTGNAKERGANRAATGPGDLVQESERLREGERRLRALCDSTLDAVLVATDDRVYVDANPAACELFGVSREELLGSSLEDFVPEGQRDAAKEAWGAFIERGYMGGEFVLRRPDGTLRVADFRARAGFLPGQHLSVLSPRIGRVGCRRRSARRPAGTAQPPT